MYVGAYLSTEISDSANHLYRLANPFPAPLRLSSSDFSQRTEKIRVLHHHLAKISFGQDQEITIRFGTDRGVSLFSRDQRMLPEHITILLLEHSCESERAKII
jgi:hypothetical protein